MSDNREDPANPVGLGTDPIDQNASEPGQNVVGEHEAVDLDISEDIDDQTGREHVPQTLIPDTQAAGENSQPASAFSSSSEEGDDADGEGGEEEEVAGQEADDGDDAAEWNPLPVASTSPPNPPEDDFLPDPAVRGYCVDEYTGEYKLLQLRHREWQDLYPRKSYRSADKEPVGSSPLRIASSATSPISSDSSNSPVSPISPSDLEKLQDIGVLPEPSPPFQTERRSSATSFNWSEEDEDDDSWVVGAIQDVKGVGKPSDDLTESEGEGFLTADEDESSDTNEQSVTEDAGAKGSERTSEAPAQSHQPSNVEGEALDSADGPNENGEQSQQKPISPTEETERFIPEILAEQTSPNFAGPEALTGLWPEEGLFLWWQSRRAQKKQLRTNRNPFNGNVKGDLNHRGEDSPDTSDAVDHLTKQRFALKELAVSRGDNDDVQRAYKLPQDREKTHEYVKLKMLYYRAQRTHFKEEAYNTRQQVFKHEDTITNLEARVGRRDNMIKRQERKIDELYGNFNAAKKYCLDRDDALAILMPEVELGRKAMQREKSVRKELQELQVRFETLNGMAEQHKKSAEESAEQLRIEQARRSGESDLSATPLPGLEQLIRWSTTERTQLIPYMVDWINEHRETGSLEETLTPNQLESVLDAKSLSWDQLIDELKKIGYTFRPDHLAAALSDSEAINAGLIPRPISAVMYAARRLSPHTAVSDLLREVANLKQELESVRMPQDLVTQIHELETEVRRLQAQQQDPKHANLSDSIQDIVNQFVENTDLPDTTAEEIEDLQNQLAEWQEHAHEMETKIADLTQQLQVSEETRAALNIECTQAQEQISCLRSELREQSNLATELNASKSQSQTPQTDLATAKMDREELLSRIASLESSIATSTSSAQAAHDSMDRLRAQLSEVQAQANSTASLLQQKNLELEQRNAQLKQEASTSNERLSVSRTEIAALREQNDNFKAKVAAYASQTSNLPTTTATTSNIPTRPKGPKAQAWARRERELAANPAFIAERERKRAAREKQHAAERERVEALGRMMARHFGLDELEYVPVERRGVEGLV